MKHQVKKTFKSLGKISNFYTTVQQGTLICRSHTIRKLQRLGYRMARLLREENDLQGTQAERWSEFKEAMVPITNLEPRRQNGVVGLMCSDIKTAVCTISLNLSSSPFAIFVNRIHP